MRFKFYSSITCVTNNNAELIKGPEFRWLYEWLRYLVAQIKIYSTSCSCSGEHTLLLYLLLMCYCGVEIYHRDKVTSQTQYNIIQMFHFHKSHGCLQYTAGQSRAPLLLTCQYHSHNTLHRGYKITGHVLIMQGITEDVVTINEITGHGLTI